MNRYKLGIGLLILLVLLFGCKKIENTDDTADSTTTTTTDQTAPTVSSGTLSISSVSSSGLTLSWSKATDDQSAQTALKYQGWYSTSNNLDSTSTAASNGTSIADATADISSLTVTGLTASTTYYFNVVVADEAGNKTAYTAASQATSAVTSTSDTTSPVAGGSGVITASTQTYTSLLLSYSAASDETTAAANLTYKVYYSTSNNIDSVANLTANGTAATTASTATTSASVYNLSPGVTYYFNLLVSDAAGNKTVYTPVSTTTTNAIILFEVNPVDSGSLGGRSGADTLCSTSKTNNYSNLTCANIRAFISVSGTDEIQDMPTNYSVSTSLPIIGPTGLPFGTNWADLLDGSVSYSLSDAGINTNSAGWFSGSDAAGALHANNCSGWTSSSGSAEGGFKNLTTSLWITSYVFTCANFSAYSILCLCYQ